MQLIFRGNREFLFPYSSSRILRINDWLINNIIKGKSCEVKNPPSMDHGKKAMFSHSCCNCIIAVTEFSLYIKYFRSYQI